MQGRAIGMFTRLVSSHTAVAQWLFIPDFSGQRVLQRNLLSSLNLLRLKKNIVRGELTELFSAEKPLSKVLYAVGVAVIFLCVFSQYFFHLGTMMGYLVV